MGFFHVFPSQRASQKILQAFLGFLILPIAVHAQDSSGEGTSLRGDRGEIAVTVKDNSGSVLNVAASVKLLRAGGMPVAESATTHGRAFFIVPSLGDYTLVVQATGYKTVQKDVSVLAAVRMESDIYLQRDSGGPDFVPSQRAPVLAPKAKELFDKALQALGDEKPDQAGKYIEEALKLAPSNPDVLYVQGMVFLKKQKWSEAEGVLQKAAQLDPSHGPALAALGVALTNENKYDEAIPPLEKSQELDSKTGYWAHWALAKAYYHRAQYDQALKSSEQAWTESNGKAPEIELLVAQSLTAVGRYEDSAEALRDFLKNHGNDPQAATAKRWLSRLMADGKVRSQ